jgi:hypothetical protein
MLGLILQHSKLVVADVSVDNFEILTSDDGQAMKSQYTNYNKIMIACMRLH